MKEPEHESWRPTGLQGWGFGFDGEYVPTERATAERLLSFLADRRVLFSPFEMEDPGHCVQSVLQVRTFLNALLLDWPQDSVLRHHITSLRAACREFLDSVNPSELPPTLWLPDQSHAPIRPGAGGIWLDALGRFRTHVGYHVAAIMAAYGLMIEDQLGVILPPRPCDDDDAVEWNADRAAGPFFHRFWDGW